MIPRTRTVVSLLIIVVALLSLFVYALFLHRVNTGEEAPLPTRVLPSTPTQTAPPVIEEQEVASSSAPDTGTPPPSEEEEPFVFESEVPPPKGKDGCFVGGCSGQLCTDNGDVITTCEWREVYACYRTAVCERQASGACGWTDTNELSACIQSRDAR